MKINKKKLKLILEKMGLAILYIIEIKLSYKSTGILFINELNNYNKIIDDYVDLLSENNITNPVDIFNCFNQTLWNGYFSANHQFSYDLGRKLYFDNYGLGCINGEAVCLNNADMLTDVFKSCGYDATTLNCYVNTDNIKIELNDIPIHREKTPNANKLNKIIEILRNILSLATGNHAITAVNFKGKIYYFDPTNLCYLGKINNKQVAILNGEGNFDIKYLSSALFNDINLKTLKGESIDYKEQIKQSKYLDEHILEEFYNQEKERYQKIKDGCEYKIPFIFVCFSLYILTELRKALCTKITKTIEHKREDAFKKTVEKDIEEIQQVLKKIKYQ